MKKLLITMSFMKLIFLMNFFFFGMKASESGITFGLEALTLSSSKTKNGPISEFSFMERTDFKPFGEIPNYVQKKQRKTQDNRFCAKAFVQDQTTFFDCTRTRTPNGEMNGKEWCYVESYYTDDRKWDYCIPIVDYDRIRGANFLLLAELSKKAKKINHDITSNMSPAEKSFDELKKIYSQQEKLSYRISSLIVKIDSITKNINKLLNEKDDCEAKEKKLMDMLFKISGKERELKQIEEDEERKPQLITKITNCMGMLNYEDIPRGDGLLGHFFDNENWLGYYKESASSTIDYDWTDSEPLKGINQNNFSVQWEGWLRIPVTEDYVFTVECDDGAELHVDNEVVISHKVGSLVESYKQQNQLKLPNDAAATGIINKKINHFESSSKPIHFVGGTKIKIILKYFHSIHTSVYSKGQVFVKLFWQNEEYGKRLIRYENLYSSYNYPPLKITGFNPNLGKLSKLREDDFAFINSDNYIIQDIPTEFLQYTVLKLKTRYMEESLDAYSSTPTNAYIAILAHYPNPLDKDFEDTGLSMSLLQLDSIHGKTSKKLYAKKSSQMKIYKRLFRRGNIHIKFSKHGLNAKGIPLVVFFGFEHIESTLLICTGKEMVVSDSATSNFEKCTASSELPGYKCEDGFRNVMRDEEGGMWAAKSDGVGSWIEVFFSQAFELTTFKYKNRKNPSERNKELELLYSTGQKQIIKLKNNDKTISVNIDAVRATSVKITIKQVYGTLNNGGAFVFLGLKCENMKKDPELEEDLSLYTMKTSEDATITNSIDGKEDENKMDVPLDPANIMPLFEPDKNPPILLSCRDSFTNTYKFHNIRVKQNLKITVHCPESCALSPMPVYGTLIYPTDSAICKSAYHSKKIPSVGGLVTLVIKDQTENFKGSVSNGIKSSGKAKSVFSMSFEKYEEEDNILIKPGSKVDIKIKDDMDSSGGEKWAPAIITNVVDNANGKFLKMVLDSANSRGIEYPYTRDRIQPCGEHIKDRDCKGSLKRIKMKVPVLIRFIPKGYESSKDFQPDYGYVFGKAGKPYGWSTDLSKRTKKRRNPSKPLIETLIEFPSSPLSNECTKPNPAKLCEQASWKVKTGKGKFKIKVYAGDPLEEIRVDLRVNRKVFVHSAIIPKNKLMIFEDVFESKDELLEITSYCEEDCQNANTRINAVEIIPYDNSKHDFEIKQKPERETSCGSSFTGGRCEKGPDVLHCLFDDPTVSSAKYCNENMVLVNIPPTYKCKEHIGQYKCVNKLYSTLNECERYCPKACKEGKCVY